jgi:hypothetical protein
MDWQREFNYLTKAHRTPSDSDIYASLRKGALDMPEAAAIAALAVLIFERIAALEAFAAQAAESAQQPPR